MTTDLEQRLREALEEIQQGDRPLPWIVHSGCSYRRIASEPTRENLRSFPDGNVLHAYNQRSDGHPDLSMGERQLEALVRLVNAAPAVADELARLRAENEALREAVKIALACTPSARNGEVIYDCGNPWEILSAALKGSRHE